MTNVSFPIISDSSIRFAQNNSGFYKFISLSGSDGDGEKKIVAPADGYVYMYPNKSWRTRGTPPETIDPIGAVPAIDTTYDTAESGSWHLAFIPKRPLRLTDNIGRTLPQITHFVFNSPDFRIGTDFSSVISNRDQIVAFDIVETLLANYRRNHPSHRRLGIYALNEENRRYLARFDLPISESLDRSAALRFVNRYWGHAPHIPAVWPVENGDSIWELPRGQDLNVSIALVNHKYNAVSSSDALPTFYYDLNHYFQMLMNKNRLLTSENVHYERESGQEAYNTLHRRFRVVHKDHHFPARTLESSSISDFISIRGGLQNIDLSITAWNFSRELEIPREVLLVGSNEIRRNIFADIRFFSPLDVDLGGEIASQTTREIDRGFLSRRDTNFGDFPLSFDAFTPIERVSIKIPFIDSVLDSLKEISTSALGLYEEFNTWLNEYDLGGGGRTRNLDALSLFQKIHQILSDSTISASEIRRLREHIDQRKYSDFESKLFGDTGFITQLENSTERIADIVNDPRLFSNIINEFQFSYDFENLSEAQIDDITDRYEKYDFLLSSLDLLDGGEAIFAKFTEHFLSDQDVVPIESSAGLTASQMFKLFGKGGIKLSRIISKITVKHIRFDYLSRVESSALEELQSLSRYARIFAGYDVQYFYQANLQHPMFRPVVGTSADPTRLTVLLNTLDVVASWVSVAVETKKQWDSQGQSNNYTSLALSVSKAVLKTANLLPVNEQVLRILQPTRAVPFINVINIAYGLPSLAEDIGRANSRGASHHNKVFLRAAFYGSLMVGGGEYLAFFLLTGVVSLGLIIAGLALLTIGTIFSSATARSELEDLFRYCYFGVSHHNLPVAFRRFDLNIDYQVAHLNSLLSPIEQQNFSIDNGNLTFSVTPNQMSNSSTALLAMYDSRNQLVDSYLFDCGQVNPHRAVDRLVDIGYSFSNDRNLIELNVTVNNYSRSAGGVNIDVDIDDIEKILFVISFSDVPDEIRNDKDRFAFHYPHTSRVMIEEA